MKKLVALLLVLLLLFGLTSCGKQEEEQGGEVAEDAIIFQNENVRKAISLAIDRASVAKSLNDGSVAAEGIIPFKLASNPVTGADFREDQGSVVEYDADKAKEYFEKACEEFNILPL